VVIIGFMFVPDPAPQIWLNRRGGYPAALDHLQGRRRNYGCHDRHAREIEKEKILGKAEVREVFRVPKSERLPAAWCSTASSSAMRRAADSRRRRRLEGNIASLRRFKDDASEVREALNAASGWKTLTTSRSAIRIEDYVIERVAATEL